MFTLLLKPKLLKRHHLVTNECQTSVRNCTTMAIIISFHFQYTATKLIIEVIYLRNGKSTRNPVKNTKLLA